MTLADSSVWIDYFGGRNNFATELLHELLGTDELLVGDLILAEVLQGFRSDLEFRRVRDRFAAFQIHSMVGPGIAIKAAHNYRVLRARGATVRSTVDALIATFCIVNGHRLLHNDRDFDPFEQHLGLLVIRG